MIKVGLAGAGWVSEHHLDAWQSVADRATVVAIADPVMAKAEARAVQYRIPKVYASVEAMLDTAELDAIDIAAPREVHTTICRLAARRGLAILCQKPLAPTLQEAEALVAELGPGVRLMVHENWRFRPHYRQMHSWIRDGLIGDVRAVFLVLLTSGLLPDATGALSALVRQPMLAGLDRMLLMEVMIHHVDTLRFLLGPLTFVRARLGKTCTAIRGEDRASLFLRTATGGDVTLVGDFCTPGYPPEQVDWLEMHGPDGSITLHGNELELNGKQQQRLILDLASNYKASYRGVITHFLDRLQSGGTFETAPEDNLETLRIVEAAYRLNGA